MNEDEKKRNAARANPAAERSRRPANSRWSFPIGRVLGIPIRVHVSFALIVVLFWAGSTAPGGTGPVNAMLWLGLIFGCVTAHELSHSLVAKSKGIRVHAILLLPIGGVSELESMDEPAADEFAVSVVGPLTSLGLAAVAAVLAAAAGHPLLPVDLVSGPLLPRLAWFNLVIGFFNLLPAFPLDGGRVLRSLLTRTLGREAATRVAARAGRVIAALMVASGFLFNPWLMIIGFFVWFGATGEEVATVVHARLANLRVRDLMLEGPLVVDASERVDRLIAVARRTAQREFPVVRNGEYAGVVRVYALHDEPPDSVVGNLVDSTVPVVSPEASLEFDVLPLFSVPGVGALPVLDGGHIVGLLRREDLAHLLEHRAA